MSLSIYLKDPPPDYEGAARSKRKDKLFGAVISAIGLASLAFAVWPLFIWVFATAPQLSGRISIAPIPKGKVLSVQSLVNQNIQIVKDNEGFSYFTTDFKPKGNRPKDFYLTIPKLKIEKAHVLVDSTKLDENLSHFPGTALPGEVGNAFITGHSVLPQFADPKNYRAIFSKLPELEVGDTVKVESDGKKFEYVVQYKKIIDPKDLSVLAPISAGGKNLTLMTCVPPGTSLQRMVVITSLI